MKFDALHQGIIEGCNCEREFSPIEDVESVFTRCVGTEAVSARDFRSYLEANTPLTRPLKFCKDHCGHRTVSINKYCDNASAIKERYKNIQFLSPEGLEIKGDAFVCIFKLQKGAGKVWDNSHGRAEQHRSLLKSDTFCDESIMVSAVIALKDF